MTATLTRPNPAGASPTKPATGSVMRKVSLRNLAAHKLRLALTVLSQLVQIGRAHV